MLPPPPPLISPEIPSGDRHPVSYSPSILIIFALLAFAVLVIASIHLLLRSLSRSPPPIPMTSSQDSDPDPDPDPKAVVDSLPIVSLSAVTASRSPSRDCAVCLSPFEPRDRLRLLPSCRHAFHSRCIDTWLRSTLSCPLCRAPATPPPPPPEIGAISSREQSVEHLAEEKPATPPGDAVAEIAGDGGSRSWLREYVDRVASSASSSFSSVRWSRRFDPGAGNGGNWDLERNLHLHLEEEDGGFSSFYRWLVGV